MARPSEGNAQAAVRSRSVAADCGKMQEMIVARLPQRASAPSIIKTSNRQKKLKAENVAKSGISDPLALRLRAPRCRPIRESPCGPWWGPPHQPYDANAYFSEIQRLLPSSVYPGRGYLVAREEFLS